jgi:glycolate oxidase iron-sulfur subunit
VTTPPTPRGRPRRDAARVAFDAAAPPERTLLDACVHCGFCLPACPTYQLWGEEMDSPRGRILLMDLLERGEIGLTDTAVQHFDSCLGCMACETSCPSGVRYGALIEATRAQVERRYARPVTDRARRRVLFSMLPYHRRLRPVAYALAVANAARLPRPGPLALAPRLTLAGIRERPAERVAACGATRMRVVMLLGCVQRAFFPDVNAATARVLAAFGCEVLAPADQGCCGALELHAGRAGAEERRAALLDRLSALGADRIVVNSAGCGSALKDADHPAASRVVDVHELLAELQPPPFARLALRVAYHDACHLSHAQGVRSQPRALLGLVPGVDVVELAGADTCCGSAGVYNLFERDAAEQLGRRKAAAVGAAAADVLVAANPGCLIQIAAYLDPPVAVYHPVQILDRALR